MFESKINQQTQELSLADERLAALRPSWLLPVSASLVAALYLAFFLIFVHWPSSPPMSLGVFDAELIRDGNFYDAEAFSDTDTPPDDPPVVEQFEEMELALPQPKVMEPEAIRLPRKRERTEKRKNVEKTRARDVGAGQDDQRSAGQRARRFGLPGARGTGLGSTPATCLALVAESLRRHAPTHTLLGPGSAYVTFYVHVGGGVSPVSVSGSTPAHAALARRIVASARGPASCGQAFASQTFVFK